MCSNSVVLSYNAAIIDQQIPIIVAKRRLSKQQKTRIDDPDAGVVDFKYNGFGELRRQIWAPGTVYDIRIRRSGPKI